MRLTWKDLNSITSASEILPYQQGISGKSHQGGPERCHMEYKKVTETIIGCAYRVYNKMGFGFLESVYEKCMVIELQKEGLDTESHKPIEVYYDGEIVGEFVGDMIVSDTIIWELKSVRQVIKAHETQLVNYLVATGKPVGLILNFGERKVEIKRKVKDLN